MQGDPNLSELIEKHLSECFDTDNQRILRMEYDFERAAKVERKLMKQVFRMIITEYLVNKEVVTNSVEFCFRKIYVNNEAVPNQQDAVRGVWYACKVGYAVEQKGVISLTEKGLALAWSMRQKALERKSKGKESQPEFNF